MRITATSDSDPRIKRRAEVRFRMARRIAEVRTQLGWTQENLGHRIGLNRYAVGDIEAGERQLRLDEAVLICDAFGVDLADMLGAAEPVLVTEQRIEFTPHTRPR